MTTNPLSQVPRELAERLMCEIACGCLEPECIDDEEKLLKVEAVIREAIDKTLREALEIFGDSVTWTESQRRINDAIRSLSQPPRPH
jgi:hypothetical protein